MMAQAAHNLPTRATTGPATSVGRSRNKLRSNYIVMQKMRGLFPHKTAQHLSEITGYPLRTVEYWLSKNRLPGEAVGILIQSDYGLHLVLALGEAGRSSWLRRVRRALAMADAQKNQIQEAVDASRSLAHALARAETALSVHDPDFMRPHDDALGAVSRAPTGPMAQKA